MKLTEEDIEKFLSDGAYAESTEKGYRYVMRVFARWLGDRDFNEDTVREYAQERYPEKSSRNTFIEIARSFAKWKQNKIPPVGDENQIRRYELEQVRRIKPERIVQKIEEISIPMDKMREIFSLLKGEEVRFATVWCLAWFGCRPGELIMLESKDVNYERGEVVFETEKTKVQRKLYFDEFTGRQLERFIGAKRGYSFIYKVCTGLRPKVGMYLSPKSFRRTFITEMQGSLDRAGFRPVRLDILVKLMAGHTVSGDITRVYTDVARHIREAMLDHHYLLPLEGKALSSFNEPDARAILEHVERNPGTTAKDVSQGLNLSQPSTTGKLSQLEDFGYLRAEKRVKGRGRPPSEYYLTEKGREKLREI
jgi:integrase